jgi:hypothetical protein
LFLFHTLKKELAGLILSLDEFKTKREGIIRTLTEDEFAISSRNGYIPAKCVLVLVVNMSRNTRK